MSSLYGIAGSNASSPLVSKKAVSGNRLQAAEESEIKPSLLENTKSQTTTSDSQLREQVIPLLIQTIQLLLTKFFNQTQQTPGIPTPSLPTPTLNEVSGAQGAFDLSIPGAFGSNAEFNIRNLAQTNPVLAATSSVRFSPEGEPKVNDAFGFALQDIQRIDKNSDSAVDFGELVTSIGNPFVAQQYLNVLDRDKSKKIDVVEAASLLLAQDGANSLFAGIVNPFQDPGSSSQANGQVTPQEFALANLAINNFPALATETLDQLQSTLDLRNKFAVFQKSIPQLVPPNSNAPSQMTATPGFDFSQLPPLSPRFVLPKTIRDKSLDRIEDLLNLINGSIARR